MKVLAHRANVVGKEQKQENTLEQVNYALELGFGLETDIRWSSPNGFYISHDAAAFRAGHDAVQHAALWRERPNQVIALNVKELGYEKRLVEFLAQTGTANQVFLFDMELLEEEQGKTAREYARLSPNLRLAARISDRNETIDQALTISETSVIWLDEFDRLWATAEDVARLKEAGKTVYAVSPELHGFTFPQAQARWDAFAQWGVDGICTDFALALSQQLGVFPRKSIIGEKAPCSTSL